jgi:hypothetical protein
MPLASGVNAYASPVRTTDLICEAVLDAIEDVEAE